MEYKIYTMPMCDKCKEIKEFLSISSVLFSEVDLGDDDGVAELRKIYPKLKDKIQRVDGQMPIPLFLGVEEGEISSVAHTIDEVKALF